MRTAIRYLFAITSSFTVPALFASAAVSAEKIFISYGFLDFSLSVESLEIYANEGRITKEFATYAGFLEPEQLESLRNLLVQPADLTPVLISQFFYSPQGEIILQELGEIIQTKAGENGFYALRSALILAAADEEGLTLINAIRKFPTYGIRINSQRGLEVFRDINRIIGKTEDAIALVRQQSLVEVYSAPQRDFTARQDLRIIGNLPFLKQSFILKDTARQRTFPAEIYLPQLPQTSPLPLVVISHGLGSDVTTFAYLAIHLASHGFAVAVLEHPGSSAEQINALFTGLAQEVTPPEELVNRPLDVKYLLDQLEIAFGTIIDTQRVGMIGQSFGGYTSLVMAGADLNQEQLNQECSAEKNPLNVSLLLQCLALNAQLPSGATLQDERIVAAIAINPLTSIIFGQSQLSKIQVPVMMMGGSVDTVTPALLEQITPFTWLNTSEKYLALLEKGTHFSTIAGDEDSEEGGSIPVPAEAIGPNPEVAKTYLRALSLAFMKTYLAREIEYLDYLNAGYGQSISSQEMPLHLLEELDLTEEESD